MSLMGSIGPGQPVYGTDLQAQPYHAVEPEHFYEASFNCLSNLLNPHIDQAVATLRDLGVTAAPQIHGLRPAVGISGAQEGPHPMQPGSPLPCQEEPGAERGHNQRAPQVSPGVPMHRPSPQL
jgi:hypothetical protein